MKILHVIDNFGYGGAELLLATLNGVAAEAGLEFGVACLGSRLLTGSMAPERARELVDRDGTTLADAMEEPDGLGPDPDRAPGLRAPLL